jgi:hypothetical protein
VVNSNGHQKQRLPEFTAEELKAIHRELFQAGWCSEVFYEQRKRVIRKLDSFFGDERSHLKILSR